VKGFQILTMLELLFSIAVQGEGVSGSASKGGERQDTWAKPYRGIYYSALYMYSQFAGTHGWVWRIFVSVPWGNLSLRVCVFLLIIFCPFCTIVGLIHAI
jgi:hypothetical protein